MKTILIIDDNKKNLQVLGNILNDEKYKIAMAKEGVSGIKLAKKIQPDAILLDIMMPGMDGYEVCEKLKKDDNTKEIPVLFITAKNETEDIVEGFKKGGVDYITKPFNKEELLIRLKTHLDLKKAKELVKNQADELLELNKAKDKLFSVISHDLKNAIGSFKTAATMMSDQIELFDEKEIVEVTGLLKESANTTYDLMENLLFWAKSHLSAIEPEFKNIVLKEIVDSVIKIFKSNAKNKGISLTVDIPDDLLVFADAETVKIILRNLISNSLKFTNKKGSISIYTKKEDKFITVSIKDTGVGIAKENIDKVFNDKKHFTTFGTNSEKGSGIGMGLCKTYTEANGGEISITSKVGEGTTVSFTLRVCNEISVAL